MNLNFCLKIKVCSNCYYHCRCVWPDMSKLLKIASLLFLCNILRKNWVIKLIFCMQISMKACYKLIVWFWWGWPSIPKVPTTASLQYLRKEVKDEVDFLHVDSFLKVYLNTLGIKISNKVDTIIIMAWSSILKLLKVTSLQYFYNISKKKSGMEVIFGMQIDFNVSTSWYYTFWWKSPDMSKIPEIGSW